jgi:branched-chain amino acid transport system permease protein
MAGVAGWIVMTVGTTSPYVGLSFAMRGFAVALVGGLGSVSGAIAVGVGLGIAESLSTAYLPAGWADVYVFALVVAVLIWRPTGLKAGAEGAKL